jgi:hypothetical protein
MLWASYKVGRFLLLALFAPYFAINCALNISHDKVIFISIVQLIFACHKVCLGHLPSKGIHLPSLPSSLQYLSTPLFLSQMMNGGWEK